MFGFKSKPSVNPIIAQFLDAAQNGKAILIDVRDIGELKASGTVKGAKHIPLMKIAQVADSRHPDFDPDLVQTAEIAVFCASGGRSGMAAQALHQLGFGNVTNLGGFADLARAGAEVTRV